MTSKASKVSKADKIKIIPKNYFDRQEAAFYLGVSLHYFDYLVEQYFFPVIEMPHMKKLKGKKRVKKFIRISKQDLDNFMDSRKIQEIVENDFVKRTLAGINRV